MRPRGVLYFGSERRMQDEFLALVAQHPDAAWLVVHLDGLGRIDLTGVALRAVVHDARGAGLRSRFATYGPVGGRSSSG